MKALGKLLRRPEAALDRAPRIPPGRRVYAIGDVHGRADLLDRLIGDIEADDLARGEARTTIVMLGDLVDRGPASRGVIERLLTYRHARIDLAVIAGNHEEALIRILDGDTAIVDDWLRFGGRQFLQSYGIELEPGRAVNPRECIERLQAAMPAEHRAFVEGFVDTIVSGDYLFVHAGIRPGVPLERQRTQDLRWIRKPFLEHPGRHSHFVVHGHTISADVDEGAGRIGIDTGAYVSGTLTALGLEDTDRWVLQARG